MENRVGVAEKALTIPFWRFVVLVFRDQCRFTDLYGPWRRQQEAEPQRRIRLAMEAVSLAEKILSIDPKDRAKVVDRALVLAQIRDHADTFSS